MKRPISQEECGKWVSPNVNTNAATSSQVESIMIMSMARGRDFVSSQNLEEDCVMIHTPTLSIEDPGRTVDQYIISR